jgi:hypothetical protein
MNTVTTKFFENNPFEIDPNDFAYRTINPATGEVYRARVASTMEVEENTPGLKNEIMFVWNKLVSEFGPLILKHNPTARMPAIFICEHSDLISLANELAIDRTQEGEAERVMNYESAYNTIYISKDYYNKKHNPYAVQFALMEEFIHCVTSNLSKKLLGFADHLDVTELGNYAKPGIYLWGKTDENLGVRESHIEAIEQIYNSPKLNTTENLTRMFVLSFLRPEWSIAIPAEHGNPEKGITLINSEILNSFYGKIKDKEFKGSFQRKLLELLLVGDINNVKKVLFDPIINSSESEPDKIGIINTKFELRKAISDLSINIINSPLEMLPYSREYSAAFRKD